MKNKLSSRDKKTTNIRGWQVQLIEYLFTLSLVFSLNSVYWTNSNKHFQYFIISLIYSCLLLLFVFSLWKLVKKHQMTISFIRLVYFYSTFLFIFVIINFNREMIGKIEIIKFLVFFLLLLFVLFDRVTNNEIDGFWVKIVKISTILALLSLILWIAAIIGVKPDINIDITWGQEQSVPGLYGLQFFSQGKVNFLGITVLRNTGLFSEAPMYAFVLAISLALHLFILKRKLNSATSVILVMALISTTSTTGVLIVIVCVVIKIFMDQPILGKLICISTIPIWLVLIYYILSSKFQDMSSSVNYRLDDIQAGYHAWKLSPIFGNGLDNIEAIQQFMQPYRLLLGGNAGFSSGIMNILSGGGIFYFFILVAFPFIKFFFHNSLHDKIFCLIVLLLLTVTIVDGTYLFMVLAAYFLVANLGNKSYT